MSNSLTPDTADDLVRLWQESMLPTPDPEQLARRVARMTLRRFDRVIVQRNLREYAGFVLVIAFYGWQWMVKSQRLQATVAITGALFALAYLAWQHRRLTPPDPAADGRRYQAALLARIDLQIRLLRRVRYWYALPLYVPTLWAIVDMWHQSPVAAVICWLALTGTFVFIIWLNEHVAVAFLKQERARVASLYAEHEA